MIIKHLSDIDGIISGDRTYLREVLNPRRECLQIDYSLAWAQVKPGDKTIPHILVYSEVYYIVKGAGIMHINDEDSRVQSQDAVYVPPHAVQWIENTGSEPLEFLCIVNPAWHPEAERILTDTSGSHRH